LEVLTVTSNETVLRKGKHIDRTTDGVTFLVPFDNADMPDMTNVCCVEGIGIDIWEAIDGRTTVGEIVDGLLLAYDVDEDTLRKDMEEFLFILLGRKLVEVV